jgi:serine/threonine protein kinase/tetratricopeptide (TPR) repeat protein
MSGCRKDNTYHSAGDKQGPTRDMPGPRLEPGTRIGHFEIEQVIGQGGMGIVYLARDIKLARPVAVKCLPPELMADRTIRSRLEREARLLAFLSHPNIAAIYEKLDETEGATYLILEYVPGPTLADRISEGALGLEEALSVACQTAGALFAAHGHGIIHRDLKPGNIKITPKGDVKVLDFGLAKAIQENKSQSQHSTITEPGRVMGTPAYMSPEQTAGDPVDHRTDIWSLGVVVYEMFTGTLPFQGTTQQTLTHSILHGEPERLTRLRRDAPMDPERMLSKMMQKDRLNRPESMKTVVEELQAMRHDTVTDVSPSNRPPSIAVLPFVDMSPGGDQEYFCDGMAEEIINALTQIKNLHVIARTSAFSYKNRDVDVRDIGRELDVVSILEGSVRKAGNRLRITAQLVDTASGHHIWSDRYDRDLDDVFAIQDEITLAIVDKLKPRLLLDQDKARLARERDVDIEGYQLYLRGRFFWNKRGENIRKAIKYFEQALERDPDCAPAYAGLAMSYAILPIYCYMPLMPLQFETVPKAREMAERALRIDPANAEAYASLGYIETSYEWDWTGAERDFERAIELNPGCAMAYLWYGLTHLSLGRFDEAIRNVEKALALDPLSMVANRDLGMFCYYARQYDRVLAASKKTAEMDPHMSMVHCNIGAAYFGKGMYQEALNEFEEEIASGQLLVATPFACRAYLELGRLKDAQSALDRLQVQCGKRGVPPAVLGYMHIILGRHSEGFALLEKGYEQHDPGMCWLKVLPLIDCVRSDPRYIRLLEKMNLAD